VKMPLACSLTLYFRLPLWYHFRKGGAQTALKATGKFETHIGVINDVLFITILGVMRNKLSVWPT
jgi:hypothetical protein